MKIYKSFHFHFYLLSLSEFRASLFFNQSYFDYIFNYRQSLPSFLQQGTCDILPNKNGTIITQYVLQQFEPNEFLNEFKACFGFNLPTDICDKKQTRYEKNYTFDFDIDQMKKEIPMDLILQYEKNQWKNILEINPDFFYLQNGKEILLASKDFKQVENWINQNQ